MKTTSRTLSAAFLAALFALVSCDKSDIAENGVQQQTGGARTIAVSFANASVKSELNGLQPKFVADDVIKVSNGSATEDCTVEIDGSGNASITTELTGALTAVYPAAAAKMNGNAIEGVLVPTVQDGSFASANICKATIEDDATSAMFENQTAVFKLSVPAKVDEKGVDYVVKSLAVKSIGENNIADGSKEIKVGDGTSAIVADENGFYYVSVLPGETASNLYVCAGAGARKLTGDDAIAMNKIYSVALPVLNGHEYVEITMTVGATTKTYKWATMNVGATKPEDYGDYFMWGAVEKAYSSVDVTKELEAFTFGTKPASYEGKNTTWDYTKGLNWENAIYTDGVFSFSSMNVFTKYTAEENDYAKDGTADGKSVLDPEDDAARVNWGGSWRMPTKAEFDALSAITDKEWDSDKKGRTFGKSPSQIFLPAAGYGYSARLDLAGSSGYYWSSSLDTGSPCEAYYFDFYYGNVSTYYIGRYVVLSVRPFSE